MTADRQRFEIIWKTITRDVARFQGESGLSTVNSKRWTKIDDTLEELAAMLVEEVSDREREGETRTDADALLVATEDIWRYIESRLIDFAMHVEAGHPDPDKPQLIPA